MTPSDGGDEPPDGSNGEDLEAARTLLRRLIQARGFTLGEVDAKLNYARGYVSRLIHGQARLTFQHIVTILEAIGVAPALFFSTLYPYPAPPPRELQRQLRDLRAAFDRIAPYLEEPAPEIRAAPSRSTGGNVQDRIEATVREVQRNFLSSKA